MFSKGRKENMSIYAIRVYIRCIMHDINQQKNLLEKQSGAAAEIVYLIFCISLFSSGKFSIICDFNDVGTLICVPLC